MFGHAIKYLIAIMLSPLFLAGTGTMETDIKIETLNTIRAQFYVAVDNEDTTISLMNLIKREFTQNNHAYPAVVLAYYAGLEGLRGRHASNPIAKFVYVSKAVEMMNEAVGKAPESLEGRFLRFSFFHQIPGIFGMGGKVEGDLQITITMLENRDYSFVSKKIQQDMVDYLLRTERLKPQQRIRLEHLATELSKKL